MIRIFIALSISENIKDNIFSHCIEFVQNYSKFNWEAKDKIHLTLKFIGEVEDELLPKIIDKIEFVKNYTPFDCEISKFGFFFRDDIAKILWCNLETDNSILKLVDELNTRLYKFNIEPDKRKFKAHLTLLRLKTKVDQKFVDGVKSYKFEPIKFGTNRISIIQSLLKPTGSEYKVLKNYELK